jgi:predicted dehydrogenase
LARRVRVAVVGTGYGQSHIAEFAKLSDVEVAAVVSGRAERAEEVGERYGVGLRTTDYTEALALSSLDAVSIAAPPDLHREIALAALERGCHVLSEKPLAPTVADCQAMLDSAVARGLLHVTNYEWRLVPNFQKLHDLLTDGWIGEVRHARLSWLAPWESDPDQPFGWRHSRARAGFGVLGDQSHLLDDLLWNLGPLARVCAHFRTIVPERTDASGSIRGCDAEDAVAFVAVSLSGVSITGNLSRCAARGGSRVAEYEGSRGTLTLTMPDPSDRHRNTLTGRRTGEVVELSAPHQTPYESMQSKFVRAIRGEAVAPPTSFAEGLEVVRLAEAMRASSEGERWVQSPLGAEDA